MNPFGLNVLAQPGIDRAALLKYVDRAKPGMMVVMDDTALAQDIRARNPRGLTVHRSYAPHDDRWHEVVTPKEFLDAHKPTAANGVVCAVYNEPSGAGLFAASTWIEQLILSCPPDMTLATPNMAVGNPSEDEILAGKYDRILRAICGSRHYLALHEYFNTDPLAETPYYCGRFTFWLRRARQLGLPAPKIIITEHGRDVGGGDKDGWRDTGWSEDAYFARLVQSRELYKPHAIPVAVYCYGAGFSQRWQSFNVEGATTLLDKMASYEETVMPDTPTPPEGIRAVVNVRDGIRLRQAPGGVTIRSLPKGEVVTVWEQPATPYGKYVYIPVKTAAGEQGVAAQKVEVDDVWTDTFVPAGEPVAFTLKAPFRKYTITSKFNDVRSYGKHEGIDMVDATAATGVSDPMIHVGATGTVVKVGWDADGYGNYVVVDFGDNWRAIYGHMASVYVGEGQVLKSWEIIGLMGSTGNSTGAHIHVTLQHIGAGLSGYVVSDVVDPAPYIVPALTLAA